MATMYVTGCGCRRRHDSSAGDVIEQWSLLSRRVYQRILDMALADMNSAEVLQRACSSSARSTELLRLLKSGDDVNVQINTTSSPPNDLDDLGSTACDMSVSFVSDNHLHVRQVAGNTDVLSLPATEASSKASLSRGEDVSRLDQVAETERRESDSRQSVVDLYSSQPLCLRTWSHRRQSPDTSQAPGCVAETKRQVAPVDDDVRANDVDVATQSLMTPVSAVTGESSELVDVEPTDSSTCTAADAHRVDESSAEQSKHSLDEKTSTSRDLPTNRKPICPLRAEVAAELVDCDGWAPIDKDVLVGIVERLSVSCLQPPLLPPNASSSSSAVQTGACSGGTVTMSVGEFRYPLRLTTSSGRRTQSSSTPGPTGLRCAADDEVVRRDVMKRCSTPTPLQLSLRPPPHKTQRLRAPPTTMLRGGVTGRRKLGVHQRRAPVRDTWPMTSHYDGKLSTTELTMRHLVETPDPRHVWAPLEKSVVLNVVDHILVDSDEVTPDEGRRTYEQSVRRRWLKPPSLQAIGSSSTSYSAGSETSTGAGASDHLPATTAAEASIKWKSNILLRMRREQTTVATSGSHWLSLAPSALAATGS